ncbi:MAG TPA: sterol desaturase family protein [Tepidisphaeraceae bacterium]|nr:sterol desaturase family protein [Tepidisphaeraceae bacterium]
MSFSTATPVVSPAAGITDPPAPRTGARTGTAIGLGLLTLVLLAIAAYQAFPGARRVIDKAVPRVHDDVVLGLLLMPWFYAGCAVILALEYRFPARRRQRVLSVGLAQDLVWVFFEAVLRVAVVVTYAAALRAFFRAKLSFLAVDWVHQLPEWARAVAAILVIDFLAFFHHWVRHKVPAFWLFHTVHHSQREMNLFTDTRYHVVEYAIAQTVRFVPLMMLGVSNPAIVGYALAHATYTRFTHANIRTNLGPLRWLLVTPQSHRVHHSPHRRHWDLNFGVIFCVWDRLFGTHYRNDREYPRTGIRDHTFPVETSVRPDRLLVTPILQQVYPFRALWRRWFAR